MKIKLNCTVSQVSVMHVVCRCDKDKATKPNNQGGREREHLILHRTYWGPEQLRPRWTTAATPKAKQKRKWRSRCHLKGWRCSVQQHTEDNHHPIRRTIRDALWRKAHGARVGSEMHNCFREDFSQEDWEAQDKAAGSADGVKHLQHWLDCAPWETCEGQSN